MVFDFKTFFQKLVNSIDPSFNEIDIEKAYYRSKRTFGEALIFFRSTEAAFEIEKMFHNLPVKDIFPGTFPCIKFALICNINLSYSRIMGPIIYGP